MWKYETGPGDPERLGDTFSFWWGSRQKLEARIKLLVWNFRTGERNWFVLDVGSSFKQADWGPISIKNAAAVRESR